MNFKMIFSEDFIENFTNIREIDKGSYATIHQLKCIKPIDQIKEGELVAMKSMNNRNMSIVRQTWLKECYLMKQLSHPQIINFYHSMKIFWMNKECYTILMEYVDGKTLEKYVLGLDNSRIQHNPELEFISDRLLKGIKYLNSQGIVHRDLKPPNVLYDKFKGLVKIIDFGLSGFFQIKGERTEEREAWSYLVDHQSYAGTPLYMPPEVLNKELKDILGLAKTDIWSLGIICYFMAAGKEPFDAPNFNAYKKVAKEGKYLKLTEPVSSRVRQLVERSLVVDLVERHSIDQLYDYWEESKLEFDDWMRK